MTEVEANRQPGMLHRMAVKFHYPLIMCAIALAGLAVLMPVPAMLVSAVLVGGCLAIGVYGVIERDRALRSQA